AFDKARFYGWIHKFGPTMVDEERDVDMEDMLRHIEPEVLLGSAKGVENLETLKNAAKKHIFNDLLTLLSKLLPKPNFMPKNTYEVKKIINPLKMRVQRIHACRNHCILYRGEYAVLEKCPNCDAIRYKSNADFCEDHAGSSIGNKRKKGAKKSVGAQVEDESYIGTDTMTQRRVPALVMWYLPWRTFDANHPEFSHEKKDCQVKGKTACVVCLNDTSYVYFKGSMKIVFMRHRCFLLKMHKYRRMKDFFDGTNENDFAPKLATGKIVFEMCEKVKFKLDKKSLGGADNLKRGRKQAKTTDIADMPFKMISIFFKYLPYCTIGFLGLSGKAKDGLKSRKDLVDLQIRPKLHPQELPNGKQYLPPVSYNLTLDERLAMCKCLRGLKVPTEFSSNIRSLVSLKDMTLAGYNSHGCHVMITVFLAIAIRAIKLVLVKMVITRICYFFNMISHKVIDRVELPKLQLFVLETQAQLFYVISHHG
uniref:Uncharacterized protein n=1 Tax=Setaria italica TaxID=4555 RepID=K3YEH1_SETIT